MSNRQQTVDGYAGKKFKDLTDDEIDLTLVDDLRAAYRTLRDHHIAETSSLFAKLSAARAELDASPHPLGSDAAAMAHLDDDDEVKA